VYCGVIIIVAVYDVCHVVVSIAAAGPTTPRIAGEWLSFLFTDYHRHLMLLILSLVL